MQEALADELCGYLRFKYGSFKAQDRAVLNLRLRFRIKLISLLPL